jgi:SAM-dependent methyltransferase
MISKPNSVDPLSVKPFSPACERNREPILQILSSLLARKPGRLLEIGSGTGQHAVYFAPHFPQTEWVVSDVRAHHEGIVQWLRESNCPNLVGPLELEIGKDSLGRAAYDFVYISNVLHIMSFNLVQVLIAELGQALRPSGQVIIYGPFNYNGKFTSDSNREFDRQLKERDALSGIRDFEEIVRLMELASLFLENDHAMPANNRLLVFGKKD